MNNIKFKRLIPSVILSVFIVVQAPLSVLAATDGEAQAAARRGVDYLAANQQPDGSISGLFGSETEWSVVAAQASGRNVSTIINGDKSMLDFLEAGPKPTASATDIENKIIAITAAGQDVTNFGGIDYSTLLKNYHSSNQIGNTALLNDDYFGVIAADASGQQSLKPMAQDGLDYFLAHQSTEDGGFGFATPDYYGNCCSGSSVDMTAAAIMAMIAAEHLSLTGSELATAKAKAIDYMLKNQNDDAGFTGFTPGVSDTDTTAWVLMALNTIGDSVRCQALQARNWLVANQSDADGSFGYGTSTTPHAVTALTGNNWLLRPATVTAATPSCLPPVPDQPPAVISNSTASPIPILLSSAPGNRSQPIITNNGNAQLARLTDDEVVDPAPPQVKSATDSIKPGKEASGTATIQANKSSHSYAAYGVGLLSLVALAWFMLESLKAPKKGQSNGT